MSRIYVGTSGWSYAEWRELFYPRGLPSGEWLEHYAEHFPTVELNASYYYWPPSSRFARWAERLPPRFRMSVKAPRDLTHDLRLRSPGQWTEQIAADLARLGDRLGALLVQLPPTFAYDGERLDTFLGQVPERIPVAVEFRHPSWHQEEESFAILARHDAAYCIAHGAGLPCLPRVTATFAYVRLHGTDPHKLYAGAYDEEALQAWAKRARGWAAGGTEVYLYFNNAGPGDAVRNAGTLRDMI